MQHRKSTTQCLFLAIFLLFGFNSFANNYYLSSSTGNDNNSGTDPSSPWQSLNKLNSFRNFSSGDNIYFKRGDTFYGSITINNSGSSGNPITYDAYGSGADPIISGFTSVTNWNNLGGNIWESADAVSSLSSCNVVTVNGQNTPMGRYPNSGYLTYQTYSGNSSITSNSLTGSINWTGGEAVIKRDRYAIDRNDISSQQGSTLYLSGGGITPTKNNNYGFFIQNSSKTLDLKNEWYFNKNNKKLQIYEGNSPQNIQVSTIEIIISLIGQNYLVFNNISFIGANNTAFFIARSKNITIQNCNFDFNFNAILGEQPAEGSVDNFILRNSVINHTNNNAVVTNRGFTNALISENIIKNTGLFPGMGVGHGSVWTTYQAIYVSGTNTTIQNNEIDSTGYMGIGFDANSVTVKNNFINYFCLIKDDGGGIYTFGPGSNRVISNNIVLNGIGNGEGTYPIAQRAIGIFCDDKSSNVKVIGNSVANTGFAGIYLHNANHITVNNNTTYNNGLGLLIESDLNNFLVRDISAFDNIFFAKTIGKPFTSEDQKSIKFATTNNDISSFGSFDNNYYAKPIDENSSILATLIGVTDNNLNLSQWQSFSGFDGDSKKSPKAISDINDLRFEYNPTSSNKTISLDANYIDVEGNSYQGNITLAPYSSAVLIKNGPTTNQSPTADAGPGETITLPTNTVSLSGRGTDNDGSISSYNWTQVSGPSTATFTSSNSASTAVNGLVQGGYVFQLKVTDNQGATGTSNVHVNVQNPSLGLQNAIPPVANAGGNGTITLPQNNVQLSGLGTDEDGTITGYNWTQVSGPGEANFSSPNSAKTSVTDMVQGSYIFQLKVTDNEGATSTSTVQINVVGSEGSSNIAPVANAGGNGTITLPQNNVELSGLGTDEDGTIIGYDWTQVSGPGKANFSSPNSAKTSVTDMVQGSYIFQLKVTDNEGATGTSTVQINVVNNFTQQLVKNNISPTANAGGNGTLILPTNTVPLTGIGTDVDGTITAYNWTQVSGPAQGTFTSANTARTSVTDLVNGMYIFQLQVTDNNGATGTSTVQINVVNGTSNIAPVANAGGNGTITLPIDVVFLTGTGTDKDGNISAYSWSQISGPNQGAFTNPNSAATAVEDLVNGSYIFQLKVTDNNGATGTSTVKINVVNSAQSMRIAQQPVDSSSLNNALSVNQDIISTNAILPSQPVKVFPNPFKNSFNILLSGDAGNYKIILSDESGKILLIKTGIKSEGTLRLSIDGSGYNSGILFLNVIQNGKSSTTKIVKQ